MNNKKKYKSEALEALHGMMQDLHDVQGVDKQTMRHFDVGCLAAVDELSASEIKALREREEVSQTVFAHYLNVTKDSVSKWERGKKRPTGSSLKLLSLVSRNGLGILA